MIDIETYSYSKIRSFRECKLAFYKRYFEMDRDKISHGTSEFGSFSHEILEKYEKGELETYEMLPYYINNYDENVTSTFILKMTDTYSKDFYWKYYNSGKEYFENFTGFDDINILEAEYEFTEPIEDLFYLTGKIDLIARDNDNNLIVIDHKSKSKFKNKLEEKEYAKQLYLYSYAVNKKYGELPKTLKFNMFRKNKWVEFDFNYDDYISAIEWAKNEVKEIEACIDFEPIKKGFYCDNFCAYRHKCEYKEV